MNGLSFSATTEKRKGILLDPRTKLILLLTITTLMFSTSNEGIMNIVKPCLSLVPFALILSERRFKTAGKYLVLYAVCFILERIALTSLSGLPCADGLSRQRIHVTLRKPTKPREEIAMMQPTPNESRIHTDELVDIREVSVDKNLPKEERIAAFIRQIKNPYRFRCGDFVVNACFAGNGVTLEECLQGILR